MKLSPFKIKQILRLYQENKLTVTQIIKKFNIAYSTMYKCLRKHKIKLTGRGHRRTLPEYSKEEQIQMIRERLGILGKPQKSYREYKLDEQEKQLKGKSIGLKRLERKENPPLTRN